MFVGKPSPSTSPNPPHSPSPLGQSDTDAADDGKPTPGSLSPSPLACWATQSLCDLARAETELKRLRDRQATETEGVSRGLERAILGARQEERRLLERVEQDHRDAQRRLEQLQRENAAAARVSQSLLDQRLRKLSQLRELILRSGQGQDGPDQNLLLRGVAELLQPWEISLSLKKVSFRPSSQATSVTFGEIRVQEHDLCFNVGGCGARGQMCALHYGEQCGDTQGGVAGEEGRSPNDGIGAGQPGTSATGTGHLRVVRKIRLSGQSDKESGVEKSNTRHWPPRQEPPERELSQDEEPDSLVTEPQGEDLFLAVPALLNNGASEKDSRHGGNRGDSWRGYGGRGQRKQNTLVTVSDREPSSPSGGRPEHSSLSPCWSLDSQDGGDSRGRATPFKSPGGQSSPAHSYGCGTLSSSSPSPREPLTSYSLMDLTSRDHPNSYFSVSSDVSPTGNPGDHGRAPSPADSLDSCYTFIVSTPCDHSRGGSIKRAPRLSKSVADLSRKTRPHINGRSGDRVVDWRINRTSSTISIPPTLSHGHNVSEEPRAASRRKDSGVSSAEKQSDLKRSPSQGSRSLSMSTIDYASQGQHDQQDVGRMEPFLTELEDDGGLFKPQVGRLIRQFGKQGSGRSDLTLPSGVHATPQGQLFVVDCGNARVQVTDRLGNVVQQVNCRMSEGFPRRCQNYFDIAVNAKGLIALSCAAERALLVFNRHGRLLQTFGGSGMGSAKDELEAPRGVTVNRLDEFLVADIRRGTLTALKLDPKTGSRLERTVVTGFHRPCLVDACQSSGLVAVSERGRETGREPCVKVLEPGWNTIRVLGVCAGMGPVLACPWGICIDRDGDVLVADWGSQHRVLLYPAQGMGRPIINQGLSGPRGLTLMPDGHLVVSDSMHHCVKIYQYK
ncbi:uncharacterized protein LOC117593466 [Esox lucius]|uniref:uncharacterized protein LOC117593466 n=1 Tax=Esox lucius TaxID=8010 RepID=UPI001476BC2E|nr:uncharacterized protein LOC117593466 [Esox lucius]